jgi:hypothetical protein
VLEPSDGGTLVTLAYAVLKPVPVSLHVILRVLFGVKDLRADLHDNMALSLERLSDIVSAGRSA